GLSAFMPFRAQTKLSAAKHALLKGGLNKTLGGALGVQIICWVGYARQAHQYWRSVMGQIDKWDFNDQELNAKTQLVNRQKSALNLEVLEIDKAGCNGLFLDKKNGEIRASLAECECKDFNYSGNSPRKSFSPCMHIYRLAIEMELMEPVYFDSRERMRREENKMLQEKKKDPSQWGEWSFTLHFYNPQKKRQASAYDMASEIHDIDKVSKSGLIHGYNTFLNSCTCPDFRDRKLPCKHIYCLALLLGEQLELSQSEYENYKEEGSFY
ncbi:MAG: SWIM zinc finger family protein, partial [Desulfurivibrionaceae bacterium]|nr:SWIM zinc finger family protein [Desulfurivibrionaceae bacterium]